MANKLNSTGLQYLINRLKAMFATQDALDALDDRVDAIVAEGGEPNVIETVKVNGSALTPDANKAVDVPVPTTVAELSDSSDYAQTADIPTTTSALTNDGDGQSPFATQAYVGTNGGKIDYIAVNGTDQTITAKRVNITVPTVVSDLTNDAGYQDATDVQGAIDAALEDITGIDFEVVQALPATGEKGIIYLLAKTGTSPDVYEEYIWVTPTGGTAAFELIGTTQVDLSGYWSKAELVDITTAEIDAMFE